MEEETSIDMPMGKSFSFKEIVLIHLQKILKLSCVELRGGYYSIYVSKNGEEREIYHPDTREELSNGIKSLCIMLEPKFDEPAKEQYIQIEKKLELIKTKFLDASSVQETVVLSEGFYLLDEDKLLLETFRQEKMEIYFEMLSLLSHLLARMNYLEIGGGVF